MIGDRLFGLGFLLLLCLAFPRLLLRAFLLLLLLLLLFVAFHFLWLWREVRVLWIIEIGAFQSLEWFVVWVQDRPVRDVKRRCYPGRVTGVNHVNSYSLVFIAIIL